LKKRQIEHRKADEVAKYKRARNMIEENRVRVALQSELVANRYFSDPEYRDQIICALTQTTEMAREQTHQLEQQAMIAKQK